MQCRCRIRCNHERLAILAAGYGRPFPDRLTSRSGLHSVAHAGVFSASARGAVMTYRELINNLLKLPADALDTQQVAIDHYADLYAVHRIRVTGDFNATFEPGHIIIEVVS